METRWYQLRDAVHSIALSVLGRARRQHQDWFDRNDAAISNLLAEKNRLHGAYLDRPTDANKAAFNRCRCLAQQRLRERQDSWITRKVEEIQTEADRNDSRNFFTATKAIYGSEGLSNLPLIDILTPRDRSYATRKSSMTGISAYWTLCGPIWIKKLKRNQQFIERSTQNSDRTSFGTTILLRINSLPTAPRGSPDPEAAESFDIYFIFLACCNQGPAKRAKSVITAKPVSYEDEPCTGCSFILLKVQKLEKELTALRELVQANDSVQNAVNSAKVSKKKGKSKTLKQPKNKACGKPLCKSADTQDDGKIATESLVSMGDNPSEPSTSLSHSACSTGPSVGSEETSSWQDGKGKRHNGSIEPQTTPVDLLRPSADKATGNRKNEPLDRQHCVVVQGLSESDASTPKERISADLNMLQHLLNEMLNSNEKITIRAAFRIGKKRRDFRVRRSQLLFPRLTLCAFLSSEAIWLTIKVPSSPSLDVLTVYRPPRRDNMADARLLEELEKFATRPDILIMGDFNVPHIGESSTHANSSEQTFDRSFLNTALKLFLTQHVMLPTRIREGQQANCLDLVLTKSQDSIDEVSCLPPLDTPNIETVQFTEGMVLTELLGLKESKSPGPDEIPAKILKELAGELSKPLSMLFHTSFETGYLPPDWKSAWITPLCKGGSRVSANNYRLVSLTSICCKIVEKIIKQQLMQFPEQNHLLSDSQHGFRKGRSCVTNLLYCLEHWTRAVDRGDMVHAIYIDFKKAFDSVPHHRLLYKLSRAGVRGKLLMWIRSFLIGRSQAVHAGDQQSAEVAVKSGVPQGSVLGPTLFLVYVNDCANELNCDVAMFADDMKIWSTIRSEVDEARLQTNLDHLEQWSKDWLLPFNINKCTFLRVGRTSSPNHTVYCLTGKPLQEVDAQKDLGVWITTSLKPSLKCSKVAESAMSMLYLVKRAFSSFDEDCFARVFQTFVQPHLEFAIQAWRPWTAKDLGTLEKVQRRATKLVSGQWSLPYETRLASLDLFPLSYRQLRGDLIQAFSIVRNQGCCLAFGDFFELATTTNLRGHPLKLRVAGARQDTRKFFFSNRVVAACNALPEDVVMSGSVDTFKWRLDQHCSAHHNNAGLRPP
nr:unnamed protein product [Spirometra erinaceieuropaei]